MWLLLSLLYPLSYRILRCSLRMFLNPGRVLGLMCPFLLKLCKQFSSPSRGSSWASLDIMGLGFHFSGNNGLLGGHNSLAHRSLIQSLTSSLQLKVRNIQWLSRVNFDNISSIRIFVGVSNHHDFIQFFQAVQVAPSLILETMVVVAALERILLVAQELVVVGDVRIALGTPASLDASEYILVEPVDVFACLALPSGRVSLLSNSF